RQSTAWPAPHDSVGREQPRRAGVSSFGFGGVNAHVLLEEAPPAAPPVPPTESAQLIVLSGRTAAALRRSAEQLRAQVAVMTDAAPPGFLADLAYPWQTGRERFEHRLAVVAAAAAELLNHLDGYLAGAPPKGKVITGAVERMPWRELMQRAQRAAHAVLGQA